MLCGKGISRARRFTFLSFIMFVIVMICFQRLRFPDFSIPVFNHSANLQVEYGDDVAAIRQVTGISYTLLEYVSLNHKLNRRRHRIGNTRNGTVFDFYSQKSNMGFIERGKLDVIKRVSARLKVPLDCYNMIKWGPYYKDLFSNKSNFSFKKAIEQREEMVHATIDNCAEFKTTLGYISEPLTDLEESFAIAYSIVMYKDFLQVEMLLRSIYRPQNVYCIHVDTRDMVDKMTSCFDNEFVVNQSVNVVWGGFSVLHADLVCLKELLIRSKTWRYFINLTGQEYPLRTNYELVKILSSFNGSNNVEGVLREPKARLVSSGPPPYNMTAVKGAVHVLLSRDFAEFSLRDLRALKILKWAEKVAHQDEI